MPTDVASQPLTAPIARTGWWPDRVTWIVGLGSTAALAGQSASPWIVSGLIKSAGLPIEQAGLMVTAEMLAMGLVMLLVSPIVHRLPGKPTAFFAVIAIVAAQVWSTYAVGLVPLAASRVLAGIGFGVLFALASAMGARSAAPERTYAAAAVIALLIGTTINPALGFALENYGHSGVFLGVAVYSLVIALPLLVLRFPEPMRRSDVAVAVSVPVSRLSAAGVMAVMALLAVAVNGIFVFLTNIAGDVGLSGTKLGSGMAVVSFVSALGGVLAGRIGNRFGTLAPLAFGLSAMGLTLLAMTHLPNAIVFWPVFTALVTAYWFLWPYIFGLAVTVDPAGRVSAATGSAKILAGGLGSGIAGFVVSWAGLAAFGWLALALCVGALAIAVWVVRRMGREALRGA